MYVLTHNATSATAVKMATTDRVAATAYVSTLPEDQFAVIVETADDLDKVGGSTLVKIHNLLKPDAPVNKFQDNKVARGRVFKALTEAAEKAPVVDTTSGNRAAAAAKAAKKVRVPRSDVVKKIRPTDGRSGDVGFRKKCDDYPMTAVITVLVEKNPKRPGSVSEARFACYRTGQTVEDYLRAGGRGLDVKWDVEHGFISVEVK